jgi:hypothetical protein
MDGAFSEHLLIAHSLPEVIVRSRVRPNLPPVAPHGRIPVIIETQRMYVDRIATAKAGRASKERAYGRRLLRACGPATRPRPCGRNGPADGVRRNQHNTSHLCASSRDPFRTTVTTGLLLRDTVTPPDPAYHRSLLLSQGICQLCKVRIFIGRMTVFRPTNRYSRKSCPGVSQVSSAACGTSGFSPPTRDCRCPLGEFPDATPTRPFRLTQRASSRSLGLRPDWRGMPTTAAHYRPLLSVTVASGIE